MDDDCDGVIDQGIVSDGAGCVDPGLPAFPSVIDILTIAIRTGDGVNDGTDANQLSLCLTATDCWRLNVADVNDFRVGEFDVYHFEGIDLPRSAADRVQILSVNGADRWVPSCMEIQFDGEPVYCELVSAPFGNDTGEVEDWTDPNGLHLGCDTCYPTAQTHGPMVGAVTPDTARLWFRTDATRQAAVPSDVEGTQEIQSAIDEDFADDEEGSDLGNDKLLGFDETNHGSANGVAQCFAQHCEVTAQCVSRDVQCHIHQNPDWPLFRPLEEVNAQWSCEPSGEPPDDDGPVDGDTSGCPGCPPEGAMVSRSECEGTCNGYMGHLNGEFACWTNCESMF